MLAEWTVDSPVEFAWDAKNLVNYRPYQFGAPFSFLCWCLMEPYRTASCDIEVFMMSRYNYLAVWKCADDVVSEQSWNQWSILHLDPTQHLLRFREREREGETSLHWSSKTITHAEPIRFKKFLTVRLTYGTVLDDTRILRKLNKVFMAICWNFLTTLEPEI